MKLPDLQFLHREETLSRVKLTALERLTTEHILDTLLPGKRDCLKVRPDGMVLDGHHRICVLGRRGVEVNALPREIIDKTGS
jgi:hypothetical protein